ncbi:MAG: DUF1570 domain-containing protein [Rubripirellula sp.]
MHRKLLSVAFTVLVASLLASPTATAQRPNPFDRLTDSLNEAQERMQAMRERMEADREKMLRGLPRSAGFPGSTRLGSDRQPNQDSQSQTQAGGLQIPVAPIQHANGETLRVRGEDGEPVVGRLHVSAGDTHVVLMPDGMLKTFPKAQTEPSDQPFVPMDMDAIEAKLLKDPKLRGFKTIRSRRFLYVYNSSELFIRSSRTILESMYPAVKKYFQRSSVDVQEPELPLVVIAFANDDQFQEYRRMPSGVVAYYDGVSNAVLIYEKSNLSQHAPEIAIKNAISTIAHEGAHQILHNIGVQQRLSRWPMWLSEGLAEFYAPTSVQKGVRWSGLGSPNELRMFEISNDWKKNANFGNGQRVQRITAADQLDSLDYAYAWGLIHMLSRRHQKELFACIAQCSKMRPLEGTEASAPIESASEVFAKHFGNQFVATEQELHKHLMSLKYSDPVANQTHYLVIAGSSVTLTSSPERVKELQRRSIGRVSVRQFRNLALAEQAMKSLTQ